MEIEVRDKKLRHYSPESLERKRKAALINLEKARAVAKKIRESGGVVKHKTTLLKENIEKELRDNLIGAILPYFPEITTQMIIQALGGDTKMLQYITNQLVGRPKETVEQTGNIESLKTIETELRELVKRKEEQD